jgi:hypothetical protein
VPILAQGRKGAPVTLLQLSKQLQNDAFEYADGPKPSAFDYINGSCEAGVDHRR